jgi:hypothetical protein
MGYSLVALSMMILYILALMYRYSFTEVLSLVSFFPLSHAYVRTSVCGLKLLVYAALPHERRDPLEIPPMCVSCKISYSAVVK